MNEKREKEREKEKKEGVGGRSDVKDGTIGGSGDCVATHRQQKEIQRWEEQRLLEKRKKKKKGKCVVGGKVGISGEKIGQNLGSTIIFTHKFTFNH